MTPPRIAFTIGDVNGIGPEVLLKALARPELHAVCSPIVVGNARLLESCAALPGAGEASVAGLELRVGRYAIPIAECPSRAVPAPGAHDPHAGQLAGSAIERAVRMAVSGEAEGIVTMPISKEGLNAGGYHFPGHTEMLAALAGGEPLMILLTRGMRVALVTIHIPLAAVPKAITAETVRRRLEAFAGSLRNDFGVSDPQIAVLGLNPHAGENGTIGTEERDAIRPAIARACGTGIRAEGPFPADGFFARYDPARYHGILAMYHDQGLIPLKMMARGHGVNVTAGLPIVRTSPDHGTAYDIAGRGMADAESTLEAVRVAVEIIHNRRKGAPQQG
ncbi:MAG TPA: 4-hydroxythreonine-4-phosphate dehydrogenase PdxA [Candidatus Kapabacteria bacterium]|nr:4-hydroxythreonine-4-phosphate dehydrogenase PdxA [Candidatus Kapabacteria bacterium]